MQNKDKGKIKILYGKWQECGFICSLLCEGDKFSDVKCIIKNYGLKFQDILKRKKIRNYHGKFITHVPRALARSKKIIKIYGLNLD